MKYLRHLIVALFICAVASVALAGNSTPPVTVFDLGGGGGSVGKGDIPPDAASPGGGSVGKGDLPPGAASPGGGGFGKGDLPPGAASPGGGGFGKGDIPPGAASPGGGSSGGIGTTPNLAFELQVFGEDGTTVQHITVGKANWNRTISTYVPNPWGGYSILSTPKNGLSSATNQARSHKITLDKYLNAAPGSVGSFQYSPGDEGAGTFGETWTCPDYPGATFGVSVKQGENETYEKAEATFVTLLEAAMKRFPPPEPEE